MTTITEVQGTKGRKSSLRTPCVLGLALLAGLGACGCGMSSKKADAAKGTQGNPKIKAAMNLESFVVNLADPEEGRFLRVGMTLGLENPLPAKGGREEESWVPTARIRDTILGVLSTWHSDALLAPDGKQKLKEELVRALRARVPELGVREVYFTDFLVQR
jgi:flagellar FliL protein